MVFCPLIVKTLNHIVLVETKTQKDIKDENVLLKKQSALWNWLKKINELKSEDRNKCIGSYMLVSGKYVL